MTKADDDLMKFVIQRSTEKQPPLRDETMGERVQRYMFLYENGDKPEHFDDPLINKIDTYQDYGKLREKAAVNQDNSNFKNGKPVSKEFIRDAYTKKYDHFDKSTYPTTVIPQGKLGLSEDLIKLQSDINKNVEYVMGSTDDHERIEKDRAIETNTEDKDYAE